MALWLLRPTHSSLRDRQQGNSFHYAFTILYHRPISQKVKFVICFSFSRVLSSKEAAEMSCVTPEQPAVPELVLSLIKSPEQQKQPITDLSLSWAALVLLPHLR